MYEHLLKDLERTAASHHDRSVRDLCDDAHAAIARLLARQSIVRDQIDGLRATIEFIAERTQTDVFRA